MDRQILVSTYAVSRKKTHFPKATYVHTLLSKALNRNFLNVLSHSVLATVQEIKVNLFNGMTIAKQKH